MSAEFIDQARSDDENPSSASSLTSPFSSLYKTRTWSLVIGSSSWSHREMSGNVMQKRSVGSPQALPFLAGVCLIHPTNND